MGRIITPKYIVKVRHSGGVASTDSCWNSKQAGRPTAKNLAAWVAKYHESLKAGGCNEHLTTAYGHNAELRYAAVLRNDASSEIVAEWRCSFDQAREDAKQAEKATTVLKLGTKMKVLDICRNCGTVHDGDICPEQY
jgi:hypothetical protein